MLNDDGRFTTLDLVRAILWCRLVKGLVPTILAQRSKLLVKDIRGNDGILDSLHAQSYELRIGADAKQRLVSIICMHIEFNERHKLTWIRVVHRCDLGNKVTKLNDNIIG
jgi:hypothetical protein